MAETTDVIIVGARCAGSAAAIAFAQAGRSVIAVDAATFPSDTLSTHLFFSNHWAEVERLGARERVLALDPPLHVRSGMGAADGEYIEPFSPYEGIAAGSCVRRPGLDLALVETAREAGAEVREATRMTDLLRDATGRVIGIRWRDRSGATGEITAKLVVGADGRKSQVAHLVGSTEHHLWPNRRMMAYAYAEDPHTDLRDLSMQWRQGDDLATAFPCDGDLTLLLLMPPRRRAEEFRDDPEAAFDAAVARIDGYARRIEGCTRVTNIRTSVDHPSYFRHSSGPGWALAGDSGHFKDPVTAQGIRDALRFGRLLGEGTAAHLDDPAALDRALMDWEHDRDAQCLPMYQWANSLGLDDEVSPIEDVGYHWFGSRPGGLTEVLDVFSRLREPTEVFTPARLMRWILAARRDPAVDNRLLRQTVVRDVRREWQRRTEARRFRRRREQSRAACWPA